MNVHDSSYIPTHCQGLMIVDDSMDIRTLITYYFSKQGYTVLSAQNGLEALNLLKEAEVLPSLILLDLMMPVMDGVDFKREQKKETNISKIPVVVLSADIHIENKTKDMEVQGFLKKPIDLGLIKATVEKYCCKK